MLRAIDRICEENGLTYYLAYGTLIGAIRHGGIIPWDDDIDIVMPRKDYNALISLMKNHSSYDVLTAGNCRYFNQGFADVLDRNTVIKNHIFRKNHDTKLFVDVFPLDRINRPEAMDWGRRLMTWKKLSEVRLEHVQYGDSRWKDFLRKVIWVLMTPVPTRLFTKLILRLQKKASDENGRYEAVVGCGKEGRKDMYPAGTYGTPVRVPFEDGEYPVPEHWHEILSSVYGDYMQIPSPEEIARYSHDLNVYEIVRVEDEA